MTKKITCLMLALLLCFSVFVGCEPAAENLPQLPPETSRPEESPEPTPEPEPEIEGTPFSFTRSNMPVMDGSTSLVPLAQAAAGVLLGESRESVEGLTQFNRTSQSYRNLMWGGCNILIASWPAETVFEELAAENFEYEMEPIATDALIFVVNENNPVDDLTTQQIIGIYTGEITNWSEVGGNDEAILPFQRNSGAGSQALMEKLIMGDTPMMEAPTELMAGSMGELMDYVKSYDNSSNAIGYSVYYYANDMQMAEGLKIISVDGVQPTAESIRAGDYPHLSNYYTVISAFEPENSPARIMFHWLQGVEGQRLVEQEGYVPVMDLTDAPQKEATPGGYVVKTHWETLGVTENPEAKFTRLSEDRIDALAPGDDYGALYPFVGRTNYSEYGGEGHVYGLFDENGRIVCDPVYTEVAAASYYKDGLNHYVPMLLLARGVEGDMSYTLATPDGSFVSPESYSLVRVMDFGILCAENYDSTDFILYDFEGNVLMTQDDLKLDGLSLEWAGDIFDGQEGYLLAWLSDGFGSTAYLIDPQGRVLDGGWYSGEFCGSGALIIMGGDDRSAGVMDMGGNWIVPPGYLYIERLPGGYCGHMDGESHIYDLAGELLASYAEDVRVLGPGYAAEGMYYTLDGKSVPFTDEWGTTSYFGLSPVICKRAGDGITLVNINSPDEPLFIPGSAGLYGTAEQLMVNYVMGPASTLEYIVVWDGDIEHPSKLVSWDLKRVYEFEDVADGMGAFSTVVDGLTGEEYVRVNDDNFMGTLYNSDMEPVAEKGAWSGVWNGCIFKADEQWCTVWDKNGDVMFSYPIALGGGD